MRLTKRILLRYSLNLPESFTLKAIIFIILFGFLNASAYEVNVLDITNEEDTGITYKLGVAIENDEITYFYKKSKTKKEIFLPNEMQYGFVLDRRLGVESIRLSFAPYFKLDEGGVMRINYMHNLVKRERREFAIQLKEYLGIWSVEKEQKMIKKIHFCSNRKSYMLVGISRPIFLEETNEPFSCRGSTLDYSTF